MTAQISDTFLFKESSYALAGINGPELFEPQAYGFTPVLNCTACRRGYMCTYALGGNQLVLESLCINNGRRQGREIRALLPPPFGGRLPCPRQSEEEWFDLKYTNIDLPLVFSGAVLIGRHLIGKLCVNMGFQPAWKYKTVHELVFKNGILCQQHNVSKELGRYRNYFVNKHDKPKDVELINTWIDETFSLKYSL